MRVVFVQGPPRSGKDSVGHILANELWSDGVDARVYKFAEPITKWSQEFFGVSCADEEIKDQPHRNIDGMSPRQAAIAFSERAIKPVFGHDIFGKVLLRKIEADAPDVAIITDSGFMHEARPIWEQYGLDVCVAVHVHRRDTSFKNDSRSYWELPEPGTTFKFDNDSSLDYLPLLVRGPRFDIEDEVSL